eukprot:scaffold10178_cov129-Isochrysis_galbana.AAC.5
MGAVHGRWHAQRTALRMLRERERWAVAMKGDREVERNRRGCCGRTPCKDEQDPARELGLPARQVCRLQRAWNSATGLRARLHSRARLCRRLPRAPRLRRAGGRPAGSGWP